MADKWRDVVDKAIRISRSRSIRHEWKNFTGDRVLLLQDLADTQVSFDSIVAKFNVVGFLRREEEFSRQCLHVCLERQQLDEKFFPMFELIEKAIRNSSFTFDGNPDPAKNFKKLCDISIAKIVELDDVRTLEELLANLHGFERDPLYGYVRNAWGSNCPALKAACRKNHFEMVKALVSCGYRIVTSHDHEEKTSNRVRSRARRRWFVDIPSVFSPQEEETNNLNTFEGGDEINDLHNLRLMAKPAYILACYEAVVEKTLDFNMPIEVVNGSCDCSEHYNHSFSNRPRIQGILLSRQVLSSIPDKERNGLTANGDRPKSLSSLMAAQIPDAGTDFHYCPANPLFRPTLTCRDHIECNDPIFRCFDLAKMASDHADHIPEYRVEYNEIADNCKRLSVDLLDQCVNYDEVQTLLKEQAGSSKYFRYADTMRYPCLRLAIEHNHKEFVGHMYCQQTLRQEWHGGIEWQNKPATFKTLHFLLQFVLAPLFVSISISASVGRDVTELLGYPVPDLADINAAKGWKRWFLWYLYKSNRLKLNLDVPINRFLVFTAYYILFTILMVNTILQREDFDHDKVLDNDFNYYHIILSIYAIGMIWQDIMTIATLRSFRTFLKFWRVFDLCLHLELFFALVCRVIKIQTLNGSKACLCGDACWESDLCVRIRDSRETLDELQGMFFAIAATTALMRLIYWFQLNEKVGPVIINMSRVIVDIFSIVGTYLLIAISFTSGLVFILTSENYHKRYALLNSTSVEDEGIEQYAYSFWKTLETLFWTTMDPGDGEERGIHADGLLGAVATVLFAGYQIMIVIVLLNLLIAVMNATVQKVHDRKQLYWKFARTSVWIEYFDKISTLPIPFGILNIAWTIMYFATKGFFKIRKRIRNKEAARLDKSVTIQGCEYKVERWAERCKHAKLMLELMERFKDKKSCEEEQSKINLDQFKVELQRHIEAAINKHNQSNQRQSSRI